MNEKSVPNERRPQNESTTGEASPGNINVELENSENVEFKLDVRIIRFQARVASMGRVAAFQQQ